jgi:peptide deformylase
VATQQEKREAESRERRRLALAQVRQFPDPVLKQRSRAVEAFDDDLSALAKRMLSLMDDAHGAGLAAPQIGLLRRMFVYHVSEDEGPVVVVNPEIVERSDETVVGGEGCLSISLLIDEHHDVPVERHERITLRAQDLDGTVVEREVEGHEARVIQHELDHLDGILILDRTTREARGDALRLLRRATT